MVQIDMHQHNHYFSPSKSLSYHYSYHHLQFSHKKSLQLFFSLSKSKSQRCNNNNNNNQERHQMVDAARVCCMCGDVGFPDKIFRCISCNNRFQHTYCSNYYNESSDPPELCDWCQANEIKSSKHEGSSKKPTGVRSRSEYSSDKMKPHDREEGPEKRKSPAGASSPRTSTRRYKLLKDVMC